MILKRKITALLLFQLLSVVMSGQVLATQSFDLSGQASSWLVFAGEEEQLGFRYTPEISMLWSTGGTWQVDGKVSIDAASRGWFDVLSEYGDNAEIELYRGWFRLFSFQSEVRAGLQKINFGPAKIMRSLMWFDQVDVRDPLKITPGVWAILFRHYFLNNANIWLWGLYGNENLKGLETLTTREDTVESGARFQHPVPGGEMGLSYHRRHIDLDGWPYRVPVHSGNGQEDRYALDGSWDMGIGVWFEGVISHTWSGSDYDYWQEYVTLGLDYTLPIQSGVQVILEEWYGSSGPEYNEQSRAFSISALSVGTSVSLVDSLTLLGAWSWQDETCVLFMNWQRLYDRWSISGSLFSGPHNEIGLYRGEGCHFMVTFNH